MEGDISQNIFNKHKNLFIFIAVFVFLLIAVLGVFFTLQIINKNKLKQDVVMVDNSREEKPVKSDASALPEGEEKKDFDINGNGEYDGWEVEKFSFGDFYQKNDEVIEFDLDKLSLPINVKVDVANYHDFNRKIDLESGIESLNNNGFALIDNPFAGEADNFYEMYELLNDKQLPILISSDFLLYYYQNNLKTIFKEIESTTFYDTLWQTNLKLYNIAKARYEKNKAEVGVVNDPALEASRQELAFLATTLSLLQPRMGQVSKTATLDSDEMFTQSESNFYSFQLPTYLKDDIEKELALIIEAKGVHKSPVLLYEQDYSQFAVKKEYRQNTRLNNFYLASLWLNSLFPLYYKGEYCPLCLLDMDDWRINFYTAILLSKDFSDNQDLQNSWAKIYKLVSFFNGLKGDLTYLHYALVFDEVFGEEDIVDIFAKDKEEIDQKLFAMQDKLLEFNFLEIEGSTNKNDKDARRLLGMKMLSESFWPDEYINKQFIYPLVGSHQNKQLKDFDESLAQTTCAIKGQVGAYRCYPSAYDVINLIYPLALETKYFDDYFSFNYYSDSKDNLLSQLDNFSIGSWHSNTFWSILDIAKKILNQQKDKAPSYAQTELFQKRNIDMTAASLVNSRLGADILLTRQEAGKSLLSNAVDDNRFFEYRYMEPNFILVQELLANTEMVLDMFSLLEITEGENSAIFTLKEMQKKFLSSLDIIKKELKSESLSENDYKFIDAFAREYTVKDQGIKSSVVVTDYGKGGLRQNIEGVNLLLITYKKDGKNVFAVGPVFDFTEKLK